MLNASGRTGQVTIDDFDVGIAKLVGGELVNVELDGEMTQEYAARVNGVTGPTLYNGMVPVFFDSPEDAYQQNLVPIFHIVRSSMAPQQQRWFPAGHEYSVPAAGSQMVTASDGSVGPSLIEMKPWAFPYDITYEIHLRCRLRRQANLMLHHAHQRIWAYGQVFVEDSLGEDRGYYAFLEGVDALDEIADVGDRSIGFTMSLRVEAELDFIDPTVEKTTPILTVSTRSM